MKRNDLIFAGVLVAGLAGFAMWGRAPASSAEGAFTGKPEIVAATFESAWCSACKILVPRLSKVIPEFEGQPVKFVSYDYTFGQRDEIEAEAIADGVGPIYDQFEGATGFTVLFDPETEEIVEILTINHSQKAMRAAIAQALAIATSDPQAE